MVNTVQVGTKGATIPIGRQGENDATVVVFNISALIAEYGDGAVVLLVRRNKETDPYPVVVERDGETATWTVSNVDTARVGIGACELFYYVNDVLAKSIVYTTVVRESIDGSTGTQPDPYESWIEELTALGAETLTNATSAENAKDAAERAQGKAEDAQAAAEEALEEFTTPTASATTLAYGSSATATYANGHFTFGIPQGKSPDATFSGTTLVIN